MSSWLYTRSFVVLCLFTIGLQTGCADTIVFNDEGEACLSPQDSWPVPTSGGQRFEADSMLYVQVVFRNCLSSSCSSELYGTCDVTVEGDRIIINSDASYNDESGAFRSCTDDCLPLDTVCEIGSLAAGDYTVVHGTAEMALTIPSTTGVYCL